MQATSSARLRFGPNKYAAYHLLLGRWLYRHGIQNQKYCYVTLGGTELRDILSLRFVGAELTSEVWSYEDDTGRCRAAEITALELRKAGLSVRVENATIWSHQRQSELPHIYFVDLLGICAWGDLNLRFGEMFQNEVIREGDCLIITSHLGRNPGNASIRSQFSGEFDVLGIDDQDAKSVRNVFRCAHPSMTLFKALSLNGIQSELALRCFGVVKYRDGSPMGLYGYSIGPGRTDLSSFVQDLDTTYFDMSKGELCVPGAF
jgi:hypothetical protein